MLSYLQINNFALIKELDIEFDKGLNVITGETGAGKSIIIAAINIILGGASNYNFIGSYGEFLEIEALFQLDPQHEKILRNEIEDKGLSIDDHQLIIRRQIHHKKKNKCWINNHIVNLSFLRTIGNNLIDLHGQHSHQSLLDPKKHIDFIDSLGDQLFKDKKLKFRHHFTQWQSKTKQLQEFKTKQREILSKKDFLSFQFNEINQAELQANEDELLEEKLNVIQHTVKIKEIMEEANLALYEGQNETLSIRDILNQIIHQFTSIESIDQKIRVIREQLTEVQYKIEDVSDQIVDYKDSVEFSAQQLQELEDRLNLINQLKQKYGPSLEKIFQHQHQLHEQLDGIEDDQGVIDDLKNEIAQIEGELRHDSEQLSNQRKKIAVQLEKNIINELNELSMKNCHFQIQINQFEDEAGLKNKDKRFKVNDKGIDWIEFLIATNAGEKEKPLADIVSGGEVSRIMLALKSILSKVDQIPTMIFDEIDSGVGARLGEVIANKLSKLSQDHQVITVTHLPQIACRSHRHIYIRKSVVQQKTQIQVAKLAGQAQLNEIARMLDGEQYGEISLDHARKMLHREEISESEK